MSQLVLYASVTLTGAAVIIFELLKSARDWPGHEGLKIASPASIFLSHLVQPSVASPDATWYV